MRNISIIISLFIAVATGKTDSHTNKSYNSVDGSFNHGNYTYQEEVKRSNTFIYLSVFSLVIIGVGVWVYVKNKGNV
mgnify:CR=1 FL=1